MKNGILFSLPHKLEIECIRIICNVIPSAEMVKFSKTGSGAATGAVRAARALQKIKLLIAVLVVSGMIGMLVLLAEIKEFQNSTEN